MSHQLQPPCQTETRQGFVCSVLFCALVLKMLCHQFTFASSVIKASFMALRGFLRKQSE